jgi:hypothetical protein
VSDTTRWRESIRLMERVARLKRFRELNAPAIIIEDAERLVERSKALAEAEAAMNEIEDAMIEGEH